MNVKKSYVVLKAGWEYNDEYYYRPEDLGGRPVKVFVNKAKAEHEADKLAAEEFKGTYGFDPFQYMCYDDVTPEMVQQINERLVTIFGEKHEKISEDDPYNYSIPGGTPEQLMEVAKALREVAGIVLYEVVETEVE